MRARGGRVVAAVVAAALVLAGCGGGDEGGAGEGVRSERTDVPFTNCASRCTGEIDGAKYQVRLPKTWNGTLLLYSHGYRLPRPAPPDFAPVETGPAAAPTAEVATRLLAEGYALAGSAYKSNGWAVADGVAAGEQLHAWFVANVGRPDRTYVWGDSLGGLITQLLAEKHPDRFAGAAPLCGVLGGTNLNFDLAMDLAFVTKVLLDPTLKLSGYRSFEEASAAFTRAQKAVLAATKTREGIPKLALSGALVGAPAQTVNFDGSTLQSRVGVVVEAMITGLLFATVIRWEVEQRVGGNPSGTTGAGWAERVTADERRLVETLGPGYTDRLTAQLTAAGKVTADPVAREKFDRLGTPSGDLGVPTLTLHTAADPLVLAQNETVFAAKVNSSPNRRADLVQLFTTAPRTYESPAPYGAGHCVFTTAERVGTVKLLDDWVRRGVYPAQEAQKTAFGADAGLAPGYTPGDWPARAGT